MSDFGLSLLTSSHEIFSRQQAAKSREIAVFCNDLSQKLL